MPTHIKYLTLRSRLKDRSPNTIPDWLKLGEFHDIAAWDCRHRLIEHPMFPDALRRCQATESFRAISATEYGCLVTTGLAIKQFLESKADLLLLLQEDILAVSENDSYHEYIAAVSEWLLNGESAKRAFSYPCSEHPNQVNPKPFRVSHRKRVNWGAYWVLLNRAAASTWLDRTSHTDFQYRPEDKIFLDMQFQNILQTAHPQKLLVAHDYSRESTLAKTRWPLIQQGKKQSATK